MAGPAYDDETGLMRIHTVGHGTSTRQELIGLLAEAGVLAVVDVRRFPGSHKHPELARGPLETELPTQGVEYHWLEALGGRRRLSPDTQSTDPWWQVEQFRAYAAYTRTAEFSAGLNALIELGAGRSTAIMCSETVWWRCHRRIVADVLVLLHGIDVQHLMPGGRMTKHPVSDGARMSGRAVYWDQE